MVFIFIFQGPDPCVGGMDGGAGGGGNGGGGGDSGGGVRPAPDHPSGDSSPSSVDPLFGRDGWMTTRQLVILCVLMTATLTSSFAVCLFPPFFPRIAEEKGCSATVYGFIIGTNCLTSFIVTPFIGKHVSLPSDFF